MNIKYIKTRIINKTYTQEEVNFLKKQLEDNSYIVSDNPQEIIFTHEFLMDMIT